MATMFKGMDTYSASTNIRKLGLTTDTSDALHVTLNGIICLIPILLTKMKYVLTAEFQSDRIEAEFGIYRQLSGGNFHISVMQVYNSLNLQKLKLYHKLDVTRDTARCDLSSADCCKAPLTENEIELLNTCFES